jgi:membrane protein YqaA with SNARE-associated domain
LEAWLTACFTSDAGLFAVFGAAFLAATILPGGAEVFLFSFLALKPQLFWPAIAVATFGNTVGGASSYAIGRFLPEGKTLPTNAQEWLHRVRRFGTPILLLAWAPWIGDALCVAAGWLRLNIWWSLVFMAIGKYARFWVTGLAAIKAAA